VAIEILNKQRLVKVNRQGLVDLAGAALTLVCRQTGQAKMRGANPNMRPAADAEPHITVVFVRDDKMRRLNREYRGKDYATDVLSFQTGGGADEAFAFGEENHLGDLVISVDTALRQAQEAKHSLEREVQELFLHGVLHLCGYDHETDNGEMNRLELKLRKRLLDA
jgi:probable rRNA maturation factor